MGDDVLQLYVGGWRGFIHEDWDWWEDWGADNLRTMEIYI